MGWIEIKLDTLESGASIKKFEKYKDNNFFLLQAILWFEVTIPLNNFHMQTIRASSSRS